jgi:hypothetical protein
MIKQQIELGSEWAAGPRRGEHLTLREAQVIGPMINEVDVMAYALYEHAVRAQGRLNQLAQQEAERQLRAMQTQSVANIAVANQAAAPYADQAPVSAVAANMTPDHMIDMGNGVHVAAHTLEDIAQEVDVAQSSVEGADEAMARLEAVRQRVDNAYA